jgi:hypothetical protein
MSAVEKGLGLESGGKDPLVLLNFGYAITSALAHRCGFVFRGHPNRLRRLVKKL